MTRFPQLPILLVEDDPLQATIGTVRLKREGYQVHTAHSGESAIDKVRTLPEIRLVLMDIDLGLGMDGTEAAKKILEEKDIPIVFFSSHAEEAVVARVKDITRYGYVIKNSGDFVLFSSIEMAMELFLANKELKTHISRFRQIAENINEIFWIEDFHTGKISYITPSFETVFGISPQEIYDDPQVFLKLVHPDDRVKLIEEFQETKRKLADFSMEYRIILKDGSIRWIHVRNYPVYSLKGDVEKLVGFAEDITKYKLAELNNENKTKELELILNNLPLAGIYLTPSFQIRDWNQAAQKTFGYTKEEVIGKNPLDFLVWEEDMEKVTHIPQTFQALRETLPVTNRNKHKTGKIITCDWFNTPIRDEKNNLTGLIAIAQDVTERVQGEEKIQNELFAKEVLLKEIHHRVKNNMATISSLLALQADSVRDTVSQTILMDARNRISSMMVLYDKLFRSTDYKHSSLKGYLNSLVTEITVQRNKQTILMETDVEDIELDTTILYPVGIIANELVTNSLKHAFVGKERGLIRLIGRRLPDNYYCCEVWDDGIGWNPTPGSKGGFGLDLVQILAQQIHGKFHMGSSAGTTKSILTFPVPEKNL